MKAVQKNGGAREQKRRRGLTVLELLISTGIIGVLLMLLLPAVQSSREAARRMQCQNNLRQIGIALHLHHDTVRRLPSSWTRNADNNFSLGWLPSLLPYLEYGASQKITAMPASAASHSSAAFASLDAPSILICPSDLADARFALYAERESGEHDVPTEPPLSRQLLMELPHANYVGIFGTSDPDEPDAGDGDGPIIPHHVVAFRDLTSGLSNVAMVGERTARRLPTTWIGFHPEGEDGPGRVAGFLWWGPNDPDADECELDSRHPGGVQLLFADGHVRMVVDSIDDSIYRRMAQRQ